MLPAALLRSEWELDRSLPQEVEAEQALRRLLRSLERHHLQQGKQGYQEWVQASLKQGTGAFHKLTNTWGQPLQELAEERGSSGQLLVEPLFIVSSKSRRWAQL